MSVNTRVNDLTIAPHKRRAPMSYIDYYIEWFNDFLTVAYFAEYYGLSQHYARVVINKGRALFNDEYGHH